MRSPLVPLLLAMLFCRSAAAVEIEVTGIVEAKAQLVVAIFSRPDDFLEKPDAFVLVPVTAAGTLTVNWDKEVPGAFAVAVVHDLDESGRLTKNWFGVPQEPYGFSNNVRGKLGPPDFAAVRITREEFAKGISIKVE